MPMQSPDAPEPIYDFVMELCFPNRESYERMRAKLMADKTMSAAIAEDEARFLDRSSVVHYVVEDVTSVLETARPRKPRRSRRPARQKPARAKGRQAARKRVAKRRASRK